VTLTPDAAIQEAQAQILLALDRVGYMHQATTADRRKVREALDRALAALATVQEQKP
jgi:hypothetical protein